MEKINTHKTIHDPLSMQYVTTYSSKVKRLTLRLSKDGSVHVSAPRWTPQFFIDRFVSASSAWIEKNRVRLANAVTLLSSREVLYLGTRFDIKLSTRQDATVKFLADICVVAPTILDAKHTKELLSKYLFAHACAYISDRTDTLARKMHVSYSSIAFRAQKTRWGSCTSAKKLTFNWRLIHATKEVIDYVIIHELAHTLQMNHGKKFWDIVEKYDPDFRLHKRYLQKIGGSEE